jgi:hypothetical protein
MSEYIRVHRSDLEKIRVALHGAESYLRSMNNMNAALHLSDPVFSPLTTTVMNGKKRVDDLLDGINVED